jgi:predicted small metal-binding protein
MKTLACRSVGLDCDYIIKGMTEEELLKNAEQHYSEIHAIEPEEISSEMKVRIKNNIRDSSSEQ